MSELPSHRRAKRSDPTPAHAPLSCRYRFLAASVPVDDLLIVGPYGHAKAVFEWCLAALLALPALPLVVLAALAVKLTSNGPAFYQQMRLGRHGRPYMLLKVRTMHDQSERLTGPCWSLPGDKRIIRIGHFLRRTHIDELPQLWNVLRGDMSLVGPRPERPEIVPLLEAQIPGYRRRLSVRPGVTGLAQVQIPADTDIDSVRRKLAYDLYYIRRGGFTLDLRLILCTAFKMFGMSYQMQRRLFVLPHPEDVVRDAGSPLEAGAAR